MPLMGVAPISPLQALFLELQWLGDIGHGIDTCNGIDTYHGIGICHGIGTRQGIDYWRWCSYAFELDIW